MTNNILEAIQTVVDKSEKVSDRTFATVIYEKTSDGKYKIPFEGRLRSIPNGTGKVLHTGQNVWVKIPNGKLHEMHICGVRNYEGSDASATTQKDIDDLKAEILTKADKEHTHDDRYYTKIETDEKVVNINDSIEQINSTLDDYEKRFSEYTESFTIPSNVVTYTYSNSLIKSDSIIDVYIAEDNLQYLKGIDVNFVQTDGSIVFNFSKAITHSVLVSTIRISKNIGEQTKVKKIGSIDEVEVTTFDYRLSGEITEKAEEEA